jgi:SHS2 domain-containing protein
MGSFEILDHTADVGIRARGASLEEVFEQSSRGLADIMGIWKATPATGRRDLVDAQQLPVDLRAPDLGGLLVDWLGEIVYLADVKEVFLTRIHVEAVTGQGSVGPGNCTASGGLWLEPRVGGEELGTPVKAITYHRLKVVPGSSGWIAEIYVDV